MKYLNSIMITLFVIFLYSCNKSIYSDEVVTTKLSSAAVPSVYFDWETADYMPGFVGGERIWVPWASGANRYYPPHFVGDNKKAHGWELLYNTFGIPNHGGPFIFAMYNKYRGTLRMYSFIPRGLSIPSHYAQHSLELPLGLDSKMLNFSTRQYINTDSLHIKSNQIQEFRTAASGNWYGAEYDIGYDPQIINWDAATTSFRFETNSVNVQNVDINGTSSSKVDGTISNASTAGIGSTVFNAFQKGAVTVGSLAALNAFGFTGALQTSLRNAFTSAQSGSLTGLLNAVLGLGAGGTGTTFNVKMNINSRHKFTGTIQETYNIHGLSLAVPGAKNMQSTPGIIPHYNKTMGIFTLAQPPKVKGGVLVDDHRTRTGTRVIRKPADPFTIDQSTIQPVWNPAIINSSPTGARIENYNMQVFTYAITENDYAFNRITDRLTPGYQVYDFEGKKAAVVTPGVRLPQLKRSVAGREHGDSEDHLDNAYGYAHYGKEMQTEFARITFDLVPNNGDPIVRIAKSFALIWDGRVTVYTTRPL